MPARPPTLRVLAADPAARAAIADALGPVLAGLPAPSGDGAPTELVVVAPGELPPATAAPAPATLGLFAGAPDEALLAADELAPWPAPAATLGLHVARALETRRAKNLLAAESADLAALRELSDALATTANLEQTLHEVARRTAVRMETARCSIILLGDEPGVGFVVATSDDHAIAGLAIPVANAYPEILEVLRTGEPLVVEDVHTDPRFAGVRDILREKQVHHAALFPVKIGGRVQGVLHLRGGLVARPGLTERQIRFCSILANATAVAVRNARVKETLRRRAERALSQVKQRAERRMAQLEKYQRFFELSGDGIVISDGLGRMLFANQKAEAILGFESGDFAQIRLTDVVAAEGLEPLRGLLARLGGGHAQHDLDLPVIRASGELAILSISAAALDRESDDEEVIAIISIRDVTLTRRMEDELRKTKELLEKLVEASGDAVVAADMKGKVLVFNPVAERILGYKKDDVLGRLWVGDLYPPGAAYEIMRALRAGGGRFSAPRAELVSESGERIPISISAAIIHDDRGGEIATVGTFRDLREKLRLEAQLADAQAQLELSERQTAVVELAGSLAHELNQPLTAILGSAELLARKLPTPGPAAMARIVAECERMEATLKKLASITRYKTKPYLGTSNIFDLDAASHGEEKS